MAMKSEAATATGARLFHGLSDPTRLGILLGLREQGELRVTDLVARLGCSQANVSKHLACLRGCGLVTGRVDGRETHYRIEHREVERLLRAADDLLNVIGHDVALCRSHAPRTGRSRAPVRRDAS